MRKILIVEDEEVLRMLIVDSLEDEGYEIAEAEDGLDGYQMFLHGEYDLLILDNMMPNMTGLDVIKKVRQHPEKGGIKILMLTAKSQQRDEDEVRNAGADFFLAKPFSPIKLIELVEEILHG